MPEQSQTENDIYISYAPADENWVEVSLLPRLEAAGLRTITNADFLAGAPKVVSREQAVDGTRHTLLVLTPSWLSGEWENFDALLGHSSDPAGRRRKLIPLLLRKCELPARLSLLTAVDFTRPGREEAAWRQLLASLQPAQEEADASQAPPRSPRDAAQRAVLEPALAMARRTLSILERQAAGFTDLTRPAHLEIELEEQRKKVAELEAHLDELE